MISFPNAKINIGLAITEKRADGFHNLASCFYPVPWHDILEITPADNLSFQSSGIKIPGQAKDNLCLKAYHLLKKDFDIPPVSIHLHKVVPIGAGLGGGSSDGAFALKMINELFSLDISDEDLEKYAEHMGSDCPFFIKNEPRWVEGKGEIFSDIQLSLKDKFIVLAYPEIHISTKEAYGSISPTPLSIDLKSVLEGPLDLWKTQVKNDFEEGLGMKYPQINELKDYFYLKGAIFACMTGSGSTVFGIFEHEPDIYINENIKSWKGYLK